MMSDNDTVTCSQIITVGPSLEPELAGVTDAHNHLWIAPITGAAPESPVLDDQTTIVEELIAYREAGGGTIIDCQPGGCGRDGEVLLALSEAGNVNIVCCTGFHLRKYYAPDHWLFSASTDAAIEYFIAELEAGLEEARDATPNIRAGFIKIACEETLERSPKHLIQAAVTAGKETGAAIEVHTEKGADAEQILKHIIGLGLPVNKLVLCHMDKRPDFSLHQELAKAGVLLEYDTFYRPKYDPEVNVWPLLVDMVEAGLGSRVVIATDIADKKLWSNAGAGPGLSGLLIHIIPRMKVLGFEEETIKKLCGGNITACLARPYKQHIPN